MDKDNGKKRSSFHSRQSSQEWENMTEEERLRVRRKRRRELRQKQVRRKKAALGVAAVGLIALMAFLGLNARLKSDALSLKETVSDAQDSSASTENQKITDKSENVTDNTVSEGTEGTLETAKFKAAQYDYDGAISLLQTDNAYVRNIHFQNAAEKFQKKKDKCVAWSPEQVTHIFYHSLNLRPFDVFY